MSQCVKLKIRAEQAVHFPGLCVHCAQPATEWMGLKRQIGRITRLIDVPLCHDCRQHLKYLSGEEERLQKLSRLLALLALVLTMAVVLLLTPAAMALVLRLLIGLLGGLAASEMMLILFRRAQLRAALPLKKEIQDSARIVGFSWRATTFEFANETFAERFRAINEPLLMEA
jgi:hypothetical protein